MMRITGFLLIGLFLHASAVFVTAGDETFTFRYKFTQGERLRWDVFHYSRVKTTVAKTTKTAETSSKSVKLWRVTGVKPDGTATFEHLVENVDMKQKLANCPEVRYDSRTDKKPPAGFKDVAESVGAVLSVVTMDARGKILQRERKQTPAGARNKEGYMTIPLPEGPIAVGHTWSFPHTIDVPLETGGITKVKTLQRFKLESVKTGVARIRVSTVVLTPVTDPAIEAKLIRNTSEGTVRFDIDAGRVLSQQMDVDKEVRGFRGDASSLHYLTRFTEELLPVKTAIRPIRQPRRRGL